MTLAEDQPEGSFQSVVPPLIGLTLQEAMNTLPAYDLALGLVIEEVSSAIAGTIISQNVPADSEVKRWSSINVSIAVTAVETPTIAVDENIAIPKVLLPAVEPTTISEQEAQKTTEVEVPATSSSPVITQVEKQKPRPDKLEDTLGVDVPQAAETTLARENKPAEQEEKIETKTFDSEEESSNTDNAASQPKAVLRSEEPNPYNGRKLTFTVEPEGYIQVTRKITMTMNVSPSLNNDNLSYQFSISGNAHKSKSSSFTHVFDEAGTVIVTASVRIPGKPWLHSLSKRVKVGKYVAKKIKVPKIVGLSEHKAAALLKSVGLEVGNTRDKIVKGGSGIIEQMPKAGTIRTEDDNKIHYVKAVDEKFKVKLIAKSKGLEAGQEVTITVQVNPKPKKVRYRFLVGKDAYFSKSPRWKHTLKESGSVTITAEAIINGAGTFVSAPVVFSVGNAWVPPKAVISPFTVSAEQGDVIEFESASSYDSNGTLQLAWSDGTDKQSSESSFSINTESLSAGEHSITLKITDERGNVDTAVAQLIVTAKAKQEEATVADAESDVKDLVEDTNQAKDGETDLENEVPDVQESAASEELAEKMLQAQNEATLDPDLNADVLDATAAQAAAENTSKEVASDVVDAQITTNKSTSAEIINVSKQNNEGNLGFWLWGLLIALVLFPIFWILRKLGSKSKAQKQAAIPASPYQAKDAEIRAKIRTISNTENRFANLDLDDKPVTKKAKKEANPELIDFDLDVKSSGKKSKEDELINFNLDDD